MDVGKLYNFFKESCVKKSEVIALSVLFTATFAYFFWKSFSDIILDADYSKMEKLFASKKYSEFLDKSNLLLKSHPKDGNIRYLRALAFREINLPDLALAEIEACLFLGYPQVQALVLKADIMGEEKNDQDGRIEFANRAIYIDPSYDAGYYQKGLAYLYKEDYKKAEKEFMVVFSQKGELLYDAALKLAELYMNAGEFEKAREKIYFVLRKYPHSPIALATLSALKRKTGDFPLAISVISQAIEYGGKEYLYERSFINEQVGDFPSAMEDFLNWPGFKDNGNGENFYRAAKLAFRSDKNKEAANFIEKAFKNGKNDCEIFLLNARILFKDGKVEESKKNLNLALKDKKCFNQAKAILENIPMVKN